MVELRAAEYDDKEYDGCGRMSIAAIDTDSVTIVLCRKCLEDLLDSVREFENTVFCHQCQYFVMSQDGWKYGGSCCKRAEERGIVITGENAGYDCCVDCMGTCKYATKKE